MTITLVAAALGPVLIVVGKVISAVVIIMTIVPKISGAITAVLSCGDGMFIVQTPRSEASCECDGGYE